MVKTVERVMLCLIAVLFAGCGFNQPVEMTAVSGFEGVIWSGGTLEGTLRFRVYNPNPYALHATASEVDLSLDGAPIGHCTLSSPVRVPGDASADVVMHLKTDPDILAAVVRSGFKRLLGGADAVNILHAKGSVTGKRWLFEHDVSIDVTDTIKLR